MNKKMVKIISMICMIVMFISMASVVLAADPAVGIQPNNVTAKYNNTSAIGNVGGSIVGILRTIGVVVSVVVLIVLGIKYMMGSAEEKAEYKKTMIPYLVGAILIFAASVLAQMVYNFASGISAS